MFTRKNQSIKMYFLLLCVGIIVLAQPAAAKSVYLSANHNAQTFDAWNIGSTGLISKQGTYNLQYAFNPAGIAIDGLTGVDPITLQALPPLLFVTTEGAGGIEMINAVTLTFHGVFSAPINMGGLDADDADNILYAIQRGTSGYGGNGTSNLFIYTYNDDGTGMAQVASITLPNHGYGMSLALDDTRDILWVGDIQYDMVKAYDVDVSGVWANIVEIPALSFSVSHHPVDVAVDSKRNIVYTSGGWYSSPLLSKYEVETGVETTTNCGSPYPLGLAVDEFSGYVYMTRLYNDLTVWDCSTAPFTLLQDTPDLGTPAGIAIANGVGVNPLNLAKNFEIQGEGIWVGQEFTYEIICDNVLNPTLDATGVFIRDDMPVELDYVSDTVDGVPGTGVYDPVTHTVLWDIGTIPAGGAGPLVKLVVHVNDDAVEGTTINNFANIWGDDIDTSTVDPQPDPECDPEIEICDPGQVVPPPFGDIIGSVLADCPVPGTGLLGVEIDLYNGDGDLVANAITDVNGHYDMLDLLVDDYNITIVTPLGYQVPDDELPVTVIGNEVVTVVFALTCVEITASPRTIGFWKHQVGVATGGKGKAQIDAPILCDYLDLIENHFNGNAINEVIVYQPPISGLCADKLLTLKSLLNLKGSVAMVDRAKQQLMALLLNVASGKLSQTEIISADSATVSQAITYSDNLIDDPSGDHETAKTICDEINNNREVAAGVIPLSTVNIMYKRLLPNGIALDQNYPNPFNPTTEISFSLSEGADVTLGVYNVLGQNVAVLINEHLEAGHHTISWDGSRTASGVYLYRLTAGSLVETKKMVLLK